MTVPERIGILVVAAGRSERMGLDKVWADLEGRPVLAWSVAELAQITPHRLVIVAAEESVAWVQTLMKKIGVVADVVPGGRRRRDSVKAGLQAAPDVEWIAVHDAARPLVSSALVVQGVTAAQSSGAAVPALPISDTVKQVVDTRVVSTLDRAFLRSIQTPQVFRRSLLAWALDVCEDDVTDEAALVESLGGIVYTFPGQMDNFKLTYPEDLTLMRDLIRRRAGGSPLS